MKAVLLDRDGTIIVEPPGERLLDMEQAILEPAALEAFKIFADLDLKIIFITNQAGIGEGLLDPKKFEQLNGVVIQKLIPSGAQIIRTYMCPHTPADKCSCRKPKPQMLLKAAKDFDLDLSQTFMIGDRLSDIEAGINAGTKTILVKTGFHDVESPEATYTAKDLIDAAKFIANNSTL